MDDLDATHIMEHLAQVKAIKLVGEKIITFLAQLEDFQKKLWLKKKFIVGCDYCITLDRIPRTLTQRLLLMMSSVKNGFASLPSMKSKGI